MRQSDAAERFGRVMRQSDAAEPRAGRNPGGNGGEEREGGVEGAEDDDEEAFPLVRLEREIPFVYVKLAPSVGSAADAAATAPASMVPLATVGIASSANMLRQRLSFLLAMESQREPGPGLFELHTHTHSRA